MTVKITSFHKFIFIVFLISVAFIIQFFPIKSVKAKEDEKTKLPVIMYHQVTKRSSKVRKYAVSYDQLEEDLIHIKEKGYTAITLNELLKCIEGKEKLPKKPIIITFDDGFNSTKEYVLELMQKYNMKCVVSVVGSFADITEQQNDHNVNYAYLSWDEIDYLAKSNFIEIQNHSYFLHKNEKRNGASQCAGEDFDTYKRTLSEDLQKMQDKMLEETGYTPTFFTYPFGSICKNSTQILKELGFKGALTCEEIVNEIDFENTDWLFRIGRFNRSGNTTTDAFFKKFE